MNVLKYAPKFIVIMVVSDHVNLHADKVKTITILPLTV